MQEMSLRRPSDPCGALMVLVHNEWHGMCLKMKLRRGEFAREDTGVDDEVTATHK